MTLTLGRAALVTVNLVIARGADFQAAFRYSAGKPPAPVDLTGWSARGVIRDRPGSPAWIVLNSGDEIILDASGRIVVNIGHAATADSSWDGHRNGSWTLRLTNPSGNRIRFAEGQVTVAADLAAGSA